MNETRSSPARAWPLRALRSRPTRPRLPARSEACAEPAGPMGLDRLDPRLAGAVRGARVILTVTDSGREPAYARSLPVALALARASGAMLLLVDRSEETWADTPHHRGPFTPEQVRGLGKRHLYGLLDAAASAGVEVRVWIPSVPLPETYEETLSHNPVDVSVLPERFERPTLTERLAGTLAAAMAKTMVPRVPVVQVSRDRMPVLL